MPLIVLVIDLGLDTAIVDGNSTEGFLSLRVVKGLSARADLIQKLVPLVYVLFKHGEYVRGFDVPQSLIRLPSLHIFFCGIKLLFKGGIAEVETVLVHLKDQVLICLVILCCLVLLALAKLLISMCVDSLQTTNYFKLLVESLVPEGTGFGNGRV